MSRYCTDIGTDIGKKPNIGPDIGNIGFGKERVCPDIVPISAPILPISGPISGKKTQYRVLVTRYRKTQYQDTPWYRAECCHDIGADIVI